MRNLTRKEKRDFILDKIKEMELTAYDIGKKTKLSVSGIEKIINGTVKNPQEATLDKILLFLENKVLSSELNTELHKIEEPQTNYKKESNYDFAENPLVICLNKNNELIKEIIRLQGILRKNNIPFKNIFEEE